MLDRSLLVAILVGVVQGVLEWLPVSSEGNVALVLTALGESPEQVVAFALFVHLGTALSATAYYRGELRALVALVPSWRPETAFDGDHATVTFLALGSLVSGLVGVTLYVFLVRSISSIAGGTLVTLVGVLLVLTGAFQYLSASDTGARTEPDWLDAVTVGVAQGVAILPGVSRSGMTTGTLLLRGHEATQSFRLSFLLSIPAAVGGGLLAYSDSTLALGTLAAGLSLGVAAVVGYLTIGLLLRTVDELPFWTVCLGLGALVTLGGLLAV
jgi:undecaprenyl-diphosphatase